MLIVLGTNPVNNSIRLHQVLLTEQHVGLLVSRVCPQDLTRKRIMSGCSRAMCSRPTWLRPGSPTSGNVSEFAVNLRPVPYEFYLYFDL